MAAVYEGRGNTTGRRGFQFLAALLPSTGFPLLATSAHQTNVTHMQARGLYRIRDGWRTPNSVKVRYYDGYEAAISEIKYSCDGFVPDFETLPWQQDYVVPET